MTESFTASVVLQSSSNFNHPRLKLKSHYRWQSYAVYKKKQSFPPQELTGHAVEKAKVGLHSQFKLVLVVKRFSSADISVS